VFKGQEKNKVIVCYLTKYRHCHHHFIEM